MKMKPFRSRLVMLISIIFLSLSLPLGGCKKSGDGDDEEISAKVINMNFQFTSLFESQTSKVFSRVTLSFNPDQIMSGQMQVTNVDDTADVRTFNWTIYLDENSWSVQSNKTVFLEQGNYQFDLLATKGSHQYAGTAVHAIVDGENIVTMNISPVIGDILSDVDVVSRLADFKFQYDPAELATAGFTAPKMGIGVDGGADDIFNINPSTGISDNYVNLPDGTHDIKLKLYDGDVQRGKSVADQETQLVVFGNNIVMDLVALHGETTFTLTENGGDAVFNFSVPEEIINEAGGVGNLLTVFKFSSSKNASFDDVQLSLTQNGSVYEGTHTHTGVQYDDPAIITLEFTDTGVAPEYLLGSCIMSDVALDNTPHTKICVLTLRRRAAIGGNLLAVLGINVFNEADEPVSGASVYDDQILLGLTNSGSFGATGHLKSYLPASDYTIRAEDTASGKYGEQAITLFALGIANLDIVLDRDLTPLWTGTQQLGTAANESALAIARDNAGNLYIAGYTNGDLDGNTSAGGYDLFLVKYDSGGVKQWTRQLGTVVSEETMGVAIDSGGNAYVAGYTNGDLDGNTSAGEYDLFLVKYDSDGVKQWTRQLGTAVGDFASGVAVDSDDNAYVSGNTYGDLDGNTSAGDSDLFLVKYDSGGVKQWTRQLGSASFDIAMEVAVDSSDNAYVAGYTYGDLDGNANAGDKDLFLVKYDGGGVKQWTRQLGSASSDIAREVAVDSSDNAYVAGYTYGDLDGNANAGDDDLFLVKYDSGGVKQWTRQLGTAVDDLAHGVSVDGTDGNAYVVGYTHGDLDGNTSAGNIDLFLMKYNSDGVKQWTRQLGTADNDQARGVSIDSIGNAYVTGVTRGGLDGNSYAGENDLFLVKYNSDGVLQ